MLFSIAIVYLFRIWKHVQSHCLLFQTILARNRLWFGNGFQLKKARRLRKLNECENYSLESECNENETFETITENIETLKVRLEFFFKLLISQVIQTKAKSSYKVHLDAVENTSHDPYPTRLCLRNCTYMYVSKGIFLKAWIFQLESNRENSNILNLPIEVLVKIAGYLESPKNLLDFKQTCQLFNHAIDSPRTDPRLLPQTQLACLNLSYFHETKTVNAKFTLPEKQQEQENSRNREFSKLSNSETKGQLFYFLRRLKIAKEGGKIRINLDVPLALSFLRILIKVGANFQHLNELTICNNNISNESTELSSASRRRKGCQLLKSFLQKVGKLQEFVMHTSTYSENISSIRPDVFTFHATVRNNLYRYFGNFETHCTVMCLQKNVLKKLSVFRWDRRLWKSSTSTVAQLQASRVSGPTFSLTMCLGLRCQISRNSQLCLIRTLVCQSWLTKVSFLCWCLAPKESGFGPSIRILASVDSEK